MRPIDSLFVLRLDLPASSVKQQTSNEQQQQQPQKQSPALFLNSCRLICRLNFNSIRSGSITGAVKLVVLDEDNNKNNNKTPSNSNNKQNKKSTTSSMRATLSNDSTWHRGDDENASPLDNEILNYRTSFCGIEASEVTNLDFGITLDKLDGVLLQVANSLAKEINHQQTSTTTENSSSSTSTTTKNPKIHLRYTGPLRAGQGVGKAQVSTGTSTQQISVINNKSPDGSSVITQELRMVLSEVPISERCVHCGDPLDLKNIGALSLDTWSSSSPSSSSASQNQDNNNNKLTSSSQLSYCSAECKTQHEPIAKLLQPHLVPYSTPKAHRCIARYNQNNNKDRNNNTSSCEFAVFWRSVTATTFLVLVDPSNPFGVCYELLLDVLIDARQGLKLNVISRSGENKNNNNDPTKELLGLNISVYEAVLRSSIANGCVALAAACLNQMHVWCDDPFYLERQYTIFADLCIGGGWDLLRLVSTLGEYIMLIRPMFECATVLIEAALKSSISADYWYILESAKGYLISLYNINGSISFTPAVQHLRSTIVPEQQRETLLLLAKVFLLMAARSPEEQAQKMLQRAEECYTDAIEEDRLRQNLRRMAQTTLSMSALTTMIKGSETRAAQLRAQGIALLQSVAASPTAHRQHHQHCVSTIISTIGTSDELGVGVVDKQ